MKVLHVAETFKGGVATVLNSLAIYQLENDRVENVSVIIPDAHFSELSPELKGSALLFKRRSRGIASLLNLAIVLYRQIKVYNPDIVHLHSTFAGLVGRILIFLFFRKNDIKVIYCPHGFSFLMDSSKLKRIIYTECEKKLTKIVDKIICVGGNEFKEAEKAGIAQDKMVVINNGVAMPAVFNNIDCSNRDEYILLYVGRFDYQKGTDIFVDSLKILDEKKIDYKIKVIMVGESVNDSVNYQNVKYKNITISYSGWVNKSKLADYYLTSSCIIIPSRWEGLAMVPLEAISYKLPTICSNINAFEEINKISELSFVNGSIDSLVEILSNLNKYDLNSIKNNLYDKISTDYTQSVMNDKTMLLYKEVLEGIK
ncbi:glycosyltransferase [Klebsiella pneumoniae]|uniref:glycosyltransferase n=2 Tax=Klebsiella pneumoniae TaxID=573 RepID=UPI000B6EF2B1|nr:glycosyltransferase [Klebsiella pneumoniae]AUC25929.1 hypothetical protein A9493_00015 [Klebsiella pneumoniae]ELZ2428173.1 glycosyltransferase [Klebsiella pneumoniae]EMB2475541.1 glycosyltransferase [Klebsiella pneumoniae]MCP5655958.1 glycosyltransferase [Klebsiella pneumoniae]MCP5803993.1 glycosyltransferase [Klebsiella pneumoniae]